MHVGRPRPNITWYLDNVLIDDSYEHKPNGVTVNHLSYPRLTRDHINARFLCVASNTNLVPPNNKALVLEVNCKYRNHLNSIFHCTCNLFGCWFSIHYRTLSNLFICLLSVKPISVRIENKRQYFSAEKSYDVECICSGSKPAPTVTWWRGTKQIKRPIRTVSNCFILVVNMIAKCRDLFTSIVYSN